MAATSLKRREAVLLVNTRARKGAEWLEQAHRKLAESEISVSYYSGFSRASDLLTCVKAQASTGKMIVVGGGDGTLSAAANILAKTKSTMGVLPLGTGNAFARDLGIPSDLDKAIDILTNGFAEEIDLGVCNGSYFLNVASIGLSGTVAKTLTVSLKRKFGRFIYAIAIVRAIAEMRPFLARIQTENGFTEINAVQVVIGNGRYHAGPLPITPAASIIDGKLHLYAVEAGSKAELLKYALLLPTGLHGVLKTVHSEDALSATVDTAPLQSVVIDGEISGKVPLKLSIEPHALSVMVPKGFKG